MEAGRPPEGEAATAQPRIAADGTAIPADAALIRRATPADAAAIRRVHEAAFKRSAEADLVEALGSDTEISLVAEVGGEVVGHVLLSRASVADTPILALAPLGVLPGHKDAGYGRALVRAALAAARETTFPVVVVVGRPAYYAKLGFEPARRLGLRAPYKLPRETWRAARLPAWDDALSGTVRYPPAFDAV